MRETLTSRQSEILAFIRATLNEAQVTPSVAEIATAFGFQSPNAVTGHLRALRRKGYIRLRKGRARNIELIQGPGLPVIGRVAAGSPIEAVENVERYLPMPDDLFVTRPDYLLRVVGDSMINAGILDGDYIGVKRQPQADNGQIVVARLAEDVTVKRLQISRDGIMLLPENEAFEAIHAEPATFALEGIYVGLIRPE